MDELVELLSSKLARQSKVLGLLMGCLCLAPSALSGGLDMLCGLVIIEKQVVNQR